MATALKRSASARPNKRPALARKKRQRHAPDPAAVKAKIQGFAKEPWKVQIDVYLETPGSDPAFTLETCLETTSGKRIMFHNRRRPGYIIRFHLHDDDNPGYRFPPVPADAVWSKKGYACPTSGVWDVFEPFSVENGGLDLLVYNENGSPAKKDFQYTLRVFNAAGDYLPLDPGGGDKNGASN